MPLNEPQLTNKQHAVPQNIMDVEFKIIGELTMRQFIYVMIFGAIGYVIFITFTSGIKWFFIILSVSFGLALALVRLEERWLDEWVVNFFKSVYAQNQRVWRQEPIPPIAFTYQNINRVKQELITLTPTSSRRKLEEYLDSYNVSSTQKDPLDFDSNDYISRINSQVQHENTLDSEKIETRAL
ncbi:PrgI family protein [candidate division WWE3 bacterium]|uniref:PrgI family protein n=1 Tax=candidate division WWE3 bacterium TaxID=2053526 RepID=A0A955EDT6_UNCKA|nr:PrgI family protein [candidate division WWE3 bacterium]